MALLTRQESVAISPRITHLLTQVTETPDVATALWQVLSEYLTLKIEVQQQQINQFEAKWGMGFEEFAEKFGADDLEVDAYAYDVEADFWAWEQAETLRQHYESLQP